MGLPLLGREDSFCVPKVNSTQAPQQENGLCLGWGQDPTCSSDNLLGEDKAACRARLDGTDDKIVFFSQITTDLVSNFESVSTA